MEKQNKYTKSKDNLKALIIYWSATGNTEKVAGAIKRSLEQEKITPDVIKLTGDEAIEYFDYDLVFIGTPSYQFQPPEPVIKLLKNDANRYREKGSIKISAPKVPGKMAVVFCTFSGPHTGINEAIPVGKYTAQFFEHLGFEVAGEWYIVGEFHGHHDFSTEGRMGDIRGRPNTQDLSKVEKDVRKLIASLRGSSK